jgi:hypothetical protein
MADLFYAADIVALRGISPNTEALLSLGDLCYVKQYRTTTPQYVGGGGTFRWDDSFISAQADNGGTIITPTGGGYTGNGRWIRDGVRDALDFGADPTYDLTSLNNATPNTGPDSMQAFFEYITWAKNSNQEVIIPKGVYYLSFTAVGYTVLPDIDKRMTIRGAGMQNTILVPNPTQTSIKEIFRIKDTWRGQTQAALADALTYSTISDQGVTIQDLSMVSKAGCKVRGVVTFGRISELRLHNIQFSWLRTAYSLGKEADGSIPGQIKESSFSNLHALHCGARTGQDPDVAAIEIGLGSGTSDGTSDLFFDQCSVVYPESWGIRIENLHASQVIQRVRFTTLMLHGSSTFSPGTEPKAAVMRVKGRVLDLDLIGVSMNGSTLVGTTDYACIELMGDPMNTLLRPEYVTVIGDLRVCDGIGIDVVQCNSLNATLTVEQSSMGTGLGVAGSKAAVFFRANSVDVNAGARIRAFTTYGGSTTFNFPPGTNITVDASVRSYVLVERSSGDITGMHMQRMVSTDLQTIQYYDETIISNWNPNPAALLTINLPSLSNMTIGQEFFVFDGIGNASVSNIRIQAQPGDDIQNQANDFVDITTSWGKRGFRAISTSTTSPTPTRWVTWEL